MNSLRSWILLFVVVFASLFGLGGSLFAQATPPPTTVTAEFLPLGAEVTLTVESDGTPAPTFEWYKDGTKIADGSTYVIPALAKTHAGAYTVKATNPAGSATSAPYTLGVASPPVKVEIKVSVKVSVGT